MKRRQFLVTSVVGSVGALIGGLPTRVLGASRAGTGQGGTDQRKILIAGGNFGTPFVRCMAQLTGKLRPKLLYLPTASADSTTTTIDRGTER